MSPARVDFTVRFDQSEGVASIGAFADRIMRQIEQDEAVTSGVLRGRIGTPFIEVDVEFSAP